MWEDNIREWTGLEFGRSYRAVENREKMEKTGYKIICGAPTTLAVKRLMMMMTRIQQKTVKLFLCPFDARRLAGGKGHETCILVFK